MPRVTEIAYHANSAQRFAALLDRPWHVFLDSGFGGREAGRYDILSADPFATLTTRGAVTEVATRDGIESSHDDPLALVKALLGPPLPRPPEVPPGLPFAGGAIGYFAYDLGRRFERMPEVARDDIGAPDMAVGLYDWACIVDHAERRAWLVGVGRDARTFDEWDALLERVTSFAAPHLAPFEVLSDTETSLDARRYRVAFDRVKTHIREGDCYQVNLTRRFAADVAGHSWPAYERLRRLSPAPFSAYMGLPDVDVLSSSPERFLKVTSGHVETKPIKGTRPRSNDPVLDRALADQLRASAKDRAENVMIVDLLRNDLGKACRAGSVNVEKLFDIESFANVHHLVSTVVGDLRPGVHALDLVRGAFPGGSITGAPKVRAMEIIEAVEPLRRSVYCGAIGHIGFDGDLDLNIAIRTLLRRDGRMYAWAGGGVVADSRAEAEFQESLDKAAALLAVLARTVES